MSIQCNSLGQAHRHRTDRYLQAERKEDCSDGTQLVFEQAEDSVLLFVLNLLRQVIQHLIQVLGNLFLVDGSDILQYQLGLFFSPYADEPSW